MQIIIDNEEIGYLIVDEKGKIIETGEEEGLDTFHFTVVDLNSIEVGKYPRICFNISSKGKYIDITTLKDEEPKFLKKTPEIIWTNLNYKILCVN